MAFNAAAFAFGEFVLGDHPSRAAGHFDAFGKVRLKDLDGRQEPGEQRAERGGVDGIGASHAASSR